jgi:hypothetical protein
LAEEGWICYILLQQPFVESVSMPRIQQQLQSLNGEDTTAEHATLPSPFTGKCDDM